MNLLTAVALDTKTDGDPDLKFWAQACSISTEHERLPSCFYPSTVKDILPTCEETIVRRMHRVSRRVALLDLILGESPFPPTLCHKSPFSASKSHCNQVMTLALMKRFKQFDLFTCTWALPAPLLGSVTAGVHWKALGNEVRHSFSHFLAREALLRAKQCPQMWKRKGKWRPRNPKPPARPWVPFLKIRNG